MDKASKGSSAQKASGGSSTQKASGGSSTQEATGGSHTQETPGGSSALEAAVGSSAQDTLTGQSTQETPTGQSAQETTAGPSAHDSSVGSPLRDASAGSPAQEVPVNSTVTSQKQPNHSPPPPPPQQRTSKPTPTWYQKATQFSTAHLQGNVYMDAWFKFRLLMWKNLLQQWRRPVQTIAEILLPVFTMSVVLLIRWQVPPANQDAPVYPALKAYSLAFSLKVLSGMEELFLIAYSPTSPVLEDILFGALTVLVEENKDNLPEDVVGPARVDGFSIISYDNSRALSRLYAEKGNTFYIHCGVEFDDKLFGVTELPNNSISYSLRFPERPRLNEFFDIGARDWKTDELFPHFELPGPRYGFSWEGGNDPGYVNEMFIAIQHAISIELISKLTGQNIRQLFSVNIQRFPHPPYWADNSLAVLKILFPMFVMLSCSYTAINIVRSIVLERELQLKATMKIMGLPTWLHWTAWFCKQFLFQVLIAILLIIILKVRWFRNTEGFNDYAAFTYTPWSVLFFFLLLYYSCMIFFCFMLSGFFSKASSAALFTGVIWFLSYMPAYLLNSDADVSITGQIFSCFIINTAMAFGFKLLLSHECSGGLQWKQFLASPSTEANRFLFGHVVLMLCLNCVVYMLITLYLEQIFPGPFGAPRPWYFPFQRKFWHPSNNAGDFPLLDLLYPFSRRQNAKLILTYYLPYYKPNISKI